MKIKITAAQIIALRSATMREDGSYELTTAKAMTVSALTRMGVVVEGTRFLTVQGVSVMHTVVDVSVIASKGHTTYVSDTPESLELFSLRERESDDVVTVQGEYAEPSTMVDIDGSVIPYDAFRSQEIQEAQRRIADGGCVGLCAVGTGCAHCDEQYGPESSYADAESVSEGVEGDTVTTVATVLVVQAIGGSNGVNHYHAPGCRDIERESRKWNARKGMGVYEFPFSSVAAIIEHEYSDCNEGDAEWMINHANDDFDGLKIMSCLRDSLPMGDIEGRPVERKGDRWTLGDAPLDAERCTVCEVHGNVSENSTDVDGKHVCGYCVDNGRTFATLDTHSLTFYVETEGMGTKYECANCGSIDTRARFAEYVCEGAEFVETESTDDYSAVAKLSTGAGFHTVTDSVSATPVAPVATGTTHHTMDAQGKVWERFEHVLSVGDVVKVVGRQGVYEVHCLIPGLPVVYVLGTQGEPFDVPATDVYAL